MKIFLWNSQRPTTRKRPKKIITNAGKRAAFFAPEINQDPNAEPYSIVIPPPNVTGSLHMGHALQHTLMDALDTLEADARLSHALADGERITRVFQSSERSSSSLKKTSIKSRPDIGREEFVRRAWAWKEQFGNTITEQMRREGASVDWSRHRFTMDASLSLAVRNVFCTLYEEGWIYKGLRIVNWCPKGQDRSVRSRSKGRNAKGREALLPEISGERVP